MIPKWILACLMAMTIQQNAVACDACACSILGQPNGLLAAYRKSFLSLGYGHAGFNTAPGSGEGAIDNFHRIDLTFDYYFSDRFRAGIYLPYQINTRIVNHSLSSVDGLSDLRLDVNYTFFQSSIPASSWEIYLEAGAGMIFPTGKYDPDIHDRNLPENFNPGKGSLGYTIQQTSGISYRRIGTIIKNSWSSFSETNTDYQYGSQWSSSLALLAELPIDSALAFVPLASIQYEKVWTDQYASGIDVHGTGGHGLYVSAGGQLKIKDWLCTFQYAIPVNEHYSSGEVVARNRFTIQLTHLF